MQSPAIIEVILPYGITLVASKLNEITSIYSNYRVHNKNEVFNTYTIAASRGLNAGFISITLTAIDDNTTKWTSSIAPAVGGSHPPAILAGIQDDFMNVVGGFLSGKITPAAAKQAQGCLVFVFALISLMACVIAGINLLT